MNGTGELNERKKKEECTGMEKYGRTHHGESPGKDGRVPGRKKSFFGKDSGIFSQSDGKNCKRLVEEEEEEELEEDANFFLKLFNFLKKFVFQLCFSFDS